MTALTRADFFKYADDDKKDRKLKILELYKSKKPFQLKDGTNVVFKYEQLVYDKIAALKEGNDVKDKSAYNAIVFKTTKNTNKKLTDLEKSNELGGGGKGSGGGAENTRLNESSVCLWCAVYDKIGKSDYATVISNYTKAKTSYDVDETDLNMISQNDELWLTHYERVSKFLMDGMFKNGNYEFHRGSEKVKSIYKKYSELNKLLDVPFSDPNKWNPGDIWGFRKNLKLEIDDCQTLDCLNRYILNQLVDRNIVAVSLKKTEGPAKQKNFNVGEKRPPTIWNGFRVAVEGKGIFGSKDVYIYSKGEDEINMQFRSFDNLSGWQGELIGKTAKYGKAAFGIVNRNLSDLKLEILPGLQTVVTKAKTKDKNLIEELYIMFSKYSDPGVTLNNFLTTVQSPDTKADWIYSKYLGVKMIDTLMKTTQNNRNAFTQGIVGYALSNSKDSSAFIKIYD